MQGCRRYGPSAFENEHGAEERRDKGADGVEGLRQVETTRGCARRPDDGDVDICGDLHGSRAGCEYNERTQDDGETGYAAAGRNRWRQDP